VVAFGGGHGLGASLRALRRCGPELDLRITAVVTVGDDGGSSGRLRAERGALPPGDLRQALAALAGDDELSRRTADLLQHRFRAMGHSTTIGADGGVRPLGKPRSDTSFEPYGGVGSAGRPNSVTGADAGRSNSVTGADAGRPDALTGGDAGRPNSVTGGDAGRPRSAATNGGATNDTAANGASLTGASVANDTNAANSGNGMNGYDPLAGHAVGNLILCGLMELLDDPVAALDHLAALLHAGGRVLPMSCSPVGIEADVRGADPARPDAVVTVHGQHNVAVTPGQVESVRLTPSAPAACAEAVAAVADADWLIFGPGSWYTSVIPHLLVPELAAAIASSPARRLVTLNLAEEKETVGLSVPDHLAALAWYLPELRLDVVLADANAVGDPEPVRRTAESLGARLVLAPVAVTDGAARHDPVALSAALVPLLGAARYARTNDRHEVAEPAHEVTKEWR
jgi:uncharacterized cofD-like protein